MLVFSILFQIPENDHLGIRYGLLGIPLRYMHTSVETVVLKDVERTGRLLAAFIARLDDEFLDTLPWKETPSKEHDREEA